MGLRRQDKPKEICAALQSLEPFLAAATSVRLRSLVQHVLSPLLNRPGLFSDLIASKL